MILVFFFLPYSIVCPSGLRIPGFIIIIIVIITIFAQRGCGYLPFNSFFFLFFLKFAHRGRGYLLLFFFSPQPIGASDTCCVPSLSPTLWPIGAMDTCFKIFFTFWPIGASDTCLYFFFSPCPSGPRIPALLFFFPCPSGLWIPVQIFFFLIAHRGLLRMEVLVVLSGMSTDLCC